jgi:hypothetical protein
MAYVHRDFEPKLRSLQQPHKALKSLDDELELFKAVVLERAQRFDQVYGYGNTLPGRR